MLSKTTVMKAPLYAVVFVCVLMLGATAASATETSILDWWNAQTYWGDETTVSLWDALVNTSLSSPTGETWTVPADGAEGFWQLKVEYAGNAGSNRFGWYDTTTPSTLNEVFAGSAAAGATYTYSFADSQSFGFYFQGANGTFYSNHLLNDVNGSADVKQVRIFTDPRGATSSLYAHAWVLCWEDLYANTTNYNAAWTNSDYLDYASPTEPDYQDMILTFQLQYVEGATPPSTPELSTFLLAAFALAAVPVLRRRRRS